MAASGLSRAPLIGAARAAAIIGHHARTVASGVRSEAAKPRRSTKADLKREAIEIARSYGWRGRTYEKAVRFLRRLERRLKAEAAS